MHMHQEKKQSHHGWHDLLFRGVTWSLVGGLYAAMFIPVYEVGSSTLPLWLVLILASIAAAAGGALVYSSAQLAFQVAVISNFAVFGYSLASGGGISPLEPVAVGAGAGAVVGALYGFFVKKSNICRADANLLSGIVTGGGLSVLGIIWVLLFDGNLIFLVALLAPLSGVIYERIVNTFTYRFIDMIPPLIDGAVAGAAIGGFLGLGLWVMGGTLLENVAPEWLTTVNRIAYTTPVAIAAAAATSFVAGMVDMAVRKA